MREGHSGGGVGQELRLLPLAGAGRCRCAAILVAPPRPSHAAENQKSTVIDGGHRSPTGKRSPIARWSVRVRARLRPRTTPALASADALWEQRRRLQPDHAGVARSPPGRASAVLVDPGRKVGDASELRPHWQQVRDVPAQEVVACSESRQKPVVKLHGCRLVRKRSHSRRSRIQLRTERWHDDRRSPLRDGPAGTPTDIVRRER